MKSPIAELYPNKPGSPLLLCLLLLALIMLTACCANKHNTTQDNTLHNYAASNIKGNYVWAAAMNLAWTELTDNIIKEPITLDTDDAEALNTLNKLNHPVVGTDDLDAASYYVKSGYGQQTVDTINRECRAKFPNKSIPDLKLQLGEMDILAYAYLLKEVQYEVKFEQKELRWGDEWVKGFAADAESYQNVSVLSYENEDRFIVGIKLKDATDQIYLAKGYPMEQPDSLLSHLQNLAPAGKPWDEIGKRMNKKDVFHAPMLSLKHERSYEEMLGKSLKNTKFRDYTIGIMREIIKFDMDETGAKVENEAVIGLITSVGPNAQPYQPKVMILDKPYWVVMKRASSDNPYFLLGVNNNQLMKLVR